MKGLAFKDFSYVARARAFGCALLALAAAGCASVETLPAPGARPVAASAPPPPKPAPDPEKRRLVAAFGGEYVAPATKAYLDQLLARLAPASDMPGEAYRVTLLDTPVVNAFALPSGDIFVTRGLLALAGDGSEVAAVMAHEIAHISAGHAAKRHELEQRGKLFAQVSDRLLARPDESQEYDARTKITVARFSRDQEFEADRIGIRIVAKAGYDPYAASRFLEKLGRWSALKTGGTSGRPDMMATHPSTPERIAVAVAQARQIGPHGMGDTARDAYFAAIDGLPFGDNPAQGLALGTMFVHPKLGFAFRAPEGFTLDNQSAALIGVGEQGTQALRLDSFDAGGVDAVEKALASGWIDGVQTNSIETVKDADLPTAIAVAKGDQWTFRLAAIRHGGRIYRLIFAAHALTPPVDARFLAAIRSFHRLLGDEAGMAHQAHVHIVTAQPGEDAGSLAKNMSGVADPEATFLVLNGLTHNSAIPVAQKFKGVGQ
jgi:predicted Zn-dependent protease